MNQAEFEEALKNTCETVQVFLLEDPNGLSVLVRFPPGQRIVRVRHPAKRGQIFDIKDCGKLAAHVRHRLSMNKQPGDADLLNFTNWTSLAAALQHQMMDFNRRNMHREVPRLQ